MLPYVCTQADRLLWEFTARTLADMANADVVTQRADTSSHPSPARAGRADASVDRRGFPWLSLCDDLQQKVLGYVRLHVTERHERFRQTPAHMLPSMANYPGLLPRFSKRSRSFVMDVERVFSRTRKNILEWDRLLTVTFTESVNRDRLNPEISTADADWFCARSSTTQTWSGVSRIRTRVMQCFDFSGAFTSLCRLRVRARPRRWRRSGNTSRTFEGLCAQWHPRASTFQRPSSEAARTLTHGGEKRGL